MTIVLSQIDEITQQTAASSEETAGAAKELTVKSRNIGDVYTISAGVTAANRSALGANASSNDTRGSSKSAVTWSSKLNR